VPAPDSDPYPGSPSERSRWILARRGARERLDSSRAVGQFVERERTESGEIRDVATVFLANRECPWRCLMCDLWTQTLEESVAPGAIVAQIAAALASLPAVSRLKLYNAGSFFDRRAIPKEDHAPIARLLHGFDRVVVESHPTLVGSDCFRFAGRLDGRLEVAMGLETANPEVLERLNKGMTLDSFRSAAEDLGRHGIALRVFALVGLPFLPAEESLEWCRRSVGFAFDCGATAVTLIPTRAGNGALDELERRGEFSRPTLAMFERAAAESLSVHGRRGRVFADLWDLDRLGGCVSCRPARRARLEALNLDQRLPPQAVCGNCEGAA
jgi:radical SAM enzyme (TIGR01210 family)